MNKTSSIPIGLAIFSMFFGAGNSIFPLFVGITTERQWGFGLCGLLLTAVCIPLLGIFGMLRFDGKPLLFFGHIQNWVSSRTGTSKVTLLFALFIISLLGPFGSTPRCIAIGYATLFENGAVSMSLFALLSCALIFVSSLKKKYILPIIGYVLTPFLLLSLFTIILFGLMSTPSPHASSPSSFHAFTTGFSEGYKTMDLLASFFFSATILHLLAGNSHPQRLLFQGSILGGILLGIVYAGFCAIASIHAETLRGLPHELLLKRTAELVLGPHASIVVRVAITLACFTTAIALITSFTDFIQMTLFKNTPYPLLLLASLFLTYFVAICEFQSISQFLTPVLSFLYPGLILLTLINCFVPRKAPASS